MTPERFLQRWIADPLVLLGYSLLLGSAAGTWSWLQAAISGMTLDILSLVTAIVYYSVAGYAGVRLLARTAVGELSVVASLIPQVVQFQADGVAYRIICGFHLTAGFSNSGVQLSAGAMSAVQLFIGAESLPARVAVNLVPVLFLLYLYRRYKERVHSPTPFETGRRLS